MTIRVIQNESEKQGTEEVGYCIKATCLATLAYEHSDARSFAPTPKRGEPPVTNRRTEVFGCPKCDGIVTVEWHRATTVAV